MGLLHNSHGAHTWRCNFRKIGGRIPFPPSGKCGNNFIALMTSESDSNQQFAESHITFSLCSCLTCCEKHRQTTYLALHSIILLFNLPFKADRSTFHCTIDCLYRIDLQELLIRYINAIYYILVFFSCNVYVSESYILSTFWNTKCIHNNSCSGPSSAGGERLYY